MKKIITIKKVLGNIPVIECYPEGKATATLPAIVYYHGWQTNKELVVPQGRKYARKGFRVILPDAQNHGDRRAKMSDIPSLTFFQTIQGNLLEFSYLIARYQSKKLINDQIGVGGLSMGGMTTFALLTHHPEIKAAAILMGTPNLVGYRQQIKIGAKSTHIFYPDDFSELTNWIENYDLASQAEKVGQIPLYIWHGAEDKAVPFHETEAFVKQNPQLDMQVRFDNDRGHLVRPDVTNEVRDFFADKLL